MMREQTLEEHQRNGLDLDKYDIIGIHPQTGDSAVIIMRYNLEDSQKPWCLQYRGTNRHYETIEDALKYFKSRGWRFLGQK